MKNITKKNSNEDKKMMRNKNDVYSNIYLLNNLKMTKQSMILCKPNIWKHLCVLLNNSK